ncbi:MAG: hypothetical protein NTV46_03615 [Verrucomicrobia bacterium]|nr:hypothetical protein [Verrucomicrobiota bacterium]
MPELRSFSSPIRDGSQHHAIITSSYRDWSPAYQKDYRPDSMIRRARLTMGRARFRQMWEGVWEHGTEDWYDAKDLSACCTLKSPVLARRVAENSVFGFGWDTAGSTNTKADFNAGVVWAADPLPGTNTKADFNAGVVWAADPLPDSTRDVRGVWRFHGRAYRIAPVWAMQVKGRTAGELAGIIHRAHQRFGFRRIVIDHGGALAGNGAAD